MLLISCPHCGPREETEYVCGGENHIVRPGPPEMVDDDAWADYLFFRNNPKGVQYERWRHTYGCGEWFSVARDTVTHEVLAVYPIGKPKPDLQR